MDIAAILEFTMLICFGAAWPASILKSWKSRTAKGKSLFFLWVVLVGYIAGISRAFITGGAVAIVIVPYFVNAAMVMTDILIYFRNSALDRTAETA